MAGLSCGCSGVRLLPVSCFPYEEGYDEAVKDRNGVESGVEVDSIGAKDIAEEGSVALTKRQKQIYDLIASDFTIGYKEIAAILGINESAVGKHVAILKNKNLIRRIGGPKGHWNVNAKRRP